MSAQKCGDADQAYKVSRLQESFGGESNLLAKDAIGHQHHVSSQQPLQLSLVHAMLLSGLTTISCILGCAHLCCCRLQVSLHNSSLSFPHLLQWNSTWA